MNGMVWSTSKKLLLSCALFALCVLACSYLAEYVWKLAPCHLCKLQRLPYFILLLTPIMALKIRLPIVKIVIISMLSMSLLLSSYHLLVISGLMKDFCAVPTNLSNLESFMNLLENSIPCSKAGWKFFGIPVAGYNWLASFLFLLIFLRSFKTTNHFKFYETLSSAGISVDSKAL